MDDTRSTLVGRPRQFAVAEPRIYSPDGEQRRTAHLVTVGRDVHFEGRAHVIEAVVGFVNEAITNDLANGNCDGLYFIDFI